MAVSKSKKVAPKKSASKKSPLKKTAKAVSKTKVKVKAKSATQVQTKKASAKKSPNKNSLAKSSPAKKVQAKQTQTKKDQVKSAPEKSASQKTSASKSTSSKSTSSKGLNFSKVFSPLDDRILVDVSPSETKSAGGLIIVESAQEKQSRGVVVAVGPGRRNKKAVLRPLDVQLGDLVIYAQYAGTPIEVLGKEVLILREDEVLAIVNK